MKIATTPGALLKALTKVVGIVPSQSYHVAATCLHFFAEDGRLYITGTDLETHITVKMGPVGLDLFLGSEAKNDSFLAKPKMLMDTLKALPAEKEVHLTYNGDHLQITAGNGFYKIAAGNADNYPAEEFLEKKNVGEISPEFLKKAIFDVAFAAADPKSALQLEFTGIAMLIENGSLTFAATNARVLAMVGPREFEYCDSHFSEKVLIPVAAANHLAKLLKDAEDFSVSLSLSHKNATFTFDNVSITARLIDAPIPRYNSVIPGSFLHEIKVPKEELLGTVKRLLLFAKNDLSRGDFTLSGDNKLIPGQMTAFACDSDNTISASEVIPFLNVQGNDARVSLSLKFVLEAIKRINSQNVVINMVDDRTAVQFSSEDTEDGFFVIMPINTK